MPIASGPTRASLLVRRARRTSVAGGLVVLSGCSAILDVQSFSPKPSTAAVSVTAGSQLETWCAVTVGGSVECWGDNELGGLGDGTTTSSATPVSVKGLGGAASVVSEGGATACALTVTGGLFCWGYGADGELGNGKSDERSSLAVPVTGMGAGVVAVSVGFETVCAVDGAGAVWCWGSGSGDLLGSGSAKNALAPSRVTGLSSGATAVSVGSSSACAVVRGDVYCWGGADGNGELGDGSLNASAVPVKVTGLTGPVTAVSVGGGFACALSALSSLQCWGVGTSGQLGNGELASSPAPVPLPALEGDVAAVSAGESSACALKLDGTVACWGFGGDGALGNGSITFGADQNDYSADPVTVKGLSGGATSVSTGFSACATTTSGAVACWGVTGELALTPVPVTGLGSGVKGISVGGSSTEDAFACAINSAGAPACWGDNQYGQLGNTSTANSGIPVMDSLVTSGSTNVAAGTEGEFACAVQSGNALCWGSNATGQFGNGNTTSSDYPLAVENLSDIKQITTGTNSTCAVTTAGAAYCWGRNTVGELGNGTTTASLVPSPVKGLGEGVEAISMGGGYACALLADGTVDCWGDNASGQLGNGSMTNSSVPVQVPLLMDVTAISAGWTAACAVSGGSVACWGDNQYGELGNGSTAGSTSPGSVSNIDSGATRVAVGAQSACAVVSGGAFCWGSPITLGNGSGFLGSFAPVQVTGLSEGVTEIAVGAYSACAVVHGALECWGSNSSGQLGNNGTTDVLVATPVPGFP